MLSYGFATLAELKARLGISTTITAHDAILQEILNGASGAIEAAAGRQLRRSHRVVEFFTGGNTLIRTRLSPIAKVHSVRESSTRDFDDSDNYEELTENATDGFMLDRDVLGQQPGESGFIRRIGQNWLGNGATPGLIRVEYTGGYKSEEEVALENAAVTLSGSAVLDYGIKCNSEEESTYTIEDSTAEDVDAGLVGEFETQRGLFRFATTGILSVWDIVSAVLTLSVQYVGEGGTSLSIYTIQQDPLHRGQLDTLWGSPSDDDNYLAGSMTSITDAWTTKSLDLLAASATEVLAIFRESLKTGFFGFAFVGNEDDNYIEIATTENATSTYRPSLAIEHGVAFSDPFTTPDDLRHAALIQSVHDWQTRRHPGMTSQSMRGVSIASGASYSKQPSHLLPAAQAIANRYIQF